MSIIFELILRAVIEVVLFYILSIPGAFVRWICVYKRKTFNQVLENDTFKNGAIGMLVLILTIILVYFLVGQ